MPDSNDKERRSYDYQIGNLTNELHNFVIYSKERIEKLEDLNEKILIELYGANNSDGLKTMVSNLKQAEARRSKREFIQYGAILSLIAKAVWDLIKGS